MNFLTSYLDLITLGVMALYDLRFSAKVLLDLESC